MNKASNRAKRLAGMFGAVDPNELAKQAEVEKSDKTTSRPMTTAPTKALQASFASIEEENLRLKAELEKSQTVELDPVTVRASIIQDRLEWTDDDPDFQSLVTSIKEEGQRLPILVRPHPAENGQYQLAYGARRNRACMVLGQKVKAYVQELSDEELVIAQGLENNERKNLSFIEQAVYAVALLEAGFTRKLVAKSVGVASDTTISKMSAIVALVPADIFRLIGPAPKIGRNRWEAFLRVSLIEVQRSLRFSKRCVLYPKAQCGKGLTPTSVSNWLIGQLKKQTSSGRRNPELKSLDWRTKVARSERWSNPATLSKSS